MDSPNERPIQKRRRRLRERFREETTAAVIGAAEEVFARSGLHGASMGEIAKRAGVAVGTLYNHFADRQTLLAHVMDERKRELFAVLDVKLRELSRAGFVEQLTAVVSAMFAHVESHHALFVAAIMEGLPPRNDIVRELYARFDKVVKRGVKEGVLRVQGSENFSAMLLGMLRGVMMRELYGAPSGALSPMVQEVVQFFIHGAQNS